MSDKLVNGDSQKSHVLAHITSYPLVNDSISAYKSNPYGQKSISLTEDIYQRVLGPFVPYLQGPYSWVAPYLAKADEVGDNVLSKADERFPIVKTDTEKVKSTVFEYVHYPFGLAASGRDYLLNSYQDESSKVGGQGLVKVVKSVISTELRIVSDGLHVVAEYVGPKKQQAQDVISEKYDQLKQGGQQVQKKVHETADDAKKQGKDTAEEAKKQGKETADEAKKQGKETVDEAKKQTKK